MELRVRHLGSRVFGFAWFLVVGLALLGTTAIDDDYAASAPPEAFDTEGAARLSETVARARFVVRAPVPPLASGEWGPPTRVTLSTSVAVSHFDDAPPDSMASGGAAGAANGAGDPSGAPWVTVVVGPVESPPFLTTWEARSELDLQGNCDAPGDAFDPCRIELPLELERAMTGDPSSYSKVSWTLEFSVDVPHDGDSYAPNAWQVEVEPQ